MKMLAEEINKAWDRFDEAFYASASREELIENLRQIAGYNRYLLRISGMILSEKLDQEAAAIRRK